MPMELLKYDEGLSINDFIVSVHHKADKAEKHVAFQGSNLPEYLTMPPMMRQMADRLGLARDAAAGGDTENRALMNALWAELKLAVRMNGQHITMLSLYRKDPSILLNAGYELKESTPSKSAAAVHLLELTPEVSVKHDVVPESIIIMVKRPRNNASVGIQTTYGDPNLEASWENPEGVHNKSRIVQKGLEQARRIYIRARFHEDGSTGRWSQPVSIIVL